jgi:DNA repair photolyase
MEVLDEELLENHKTEIIYTHPKTIINKVVSEDIPGMYSMNPYQGCEHGCIYCYARNTHEYWGYSAGLDFEQKIIVKQNAAELLEKHFSNKNWKLPLYAFWKYRLLSAIGKRIRNHQDGFCKPV